MGAKAKRARARVRLLTRTLGAQMNEAYRQGNLRAAAEANCRRLEGELANATATMTYIRNACFPRCACNSIANPCPSCRLRVAIGSDT